jgi:hypothetical protein
MDEPPRQIDLEPNRYRQVSNAELERLSGRLEPQPVFTAAAPIKLAFLFCLFVGFWLFKSEAMAVIRWLINLVWH